MPKSKRTIGKKESKRTIGKKELRTLIKMHFNQNRFQLIWIVLYETAMIEKLTQFIPKEHAKILADLIAEVRTSSSVNELVETTKRLQKQFEKIRVMLGPRFSPELENALEPLRQKERRNVRTLWLSVGRAEGLRFMNDLLDLLDLDKDSTTQPGGSKNKVTVRKIGRNFFGPSSTSGKARAFNHLLIHKLFGTVDVFQDKSPNSTHYVRFTDEGIQWFLGIYADALHLSRDFDKKNRAHFKKIDDAIKRIFEAGRKIGNMISAIATTFVFMTNAYVSDADASENGQISPMLDTSYAEMTIKSPAVGMIEINRSAIVNFAESFGTRHFRGGIGPLHRSTDLMVADNAGDQSPKAALTNYVDFASMSNEIAINSDYKPVNHGINVNDATFISGLEVRPAKSSTMAAIDGLKMAGFGFVSHAYPFENDQVSTQMLTGSVDDIAVAGAGWAEAIRIAEGSGTHRFGGGTDPKTDSDARIMLTGSVDDIATFGQFVESFLYSSRSTTVPTERAAVADRSAYGAEIGYSLIETNFTALYTKNEGVGATASSAAVGEIDGWGVGVSHDLGGGLSFKGAYANTPTRPEGLGFLIKF